VKVKIKNYQAIKDVDLSFEPGITAIVGNSNNGKSSIIRAIEAAINNKGGSGFINYDADQCEVTIEDNGSEITWVKSNKQGKSHYVINGKEVSKIGQKQIPEVGNLLNMNEIEVNAERFRLNFWKQMEYPFLVGKTPYQLFDFISKSDEQDIIKNLQDIKKEELKSLSTDIGTKLTQIEGLTDDITATETKIKDLEPFTSYDIDLLESLNESVKSLTRLIGSYEELSLDLENSKLILEEYDEKIVGVEDLVTKLGKGIEIHKLISMALDELDKSKEQIRNDKIDDSNYGLGIEVLEEKLKKLKPLVDKVSEISKEVSQLAVLIDEVEDTSMAIELHKDDLKIHNEEIKKTEVDLGSFDMCPLCGTSIKNHDHA
jgi:exonuclease SbcC